MAPSAREPDALETVRAAKELCHAACHLADVAGRITHNSELPEVARAGEEALEASLRAAESAFALEDLSRADLESAAVLWLALDAIAIAEEAIRCSREALESMLPAPMPRQGTMA